MKLIWKPIKRKMSDAKPYSYEYDTGKIMIKMHRIIGMDTKLWFLTCLDINILSLQLKPKNDSESKKEALRIVRSKLKSMLNSIKEEK